MSTSPLYTASASLQPTSGWRVVYFDAANRGECLRLLLTVADVEFEDIRLPFPSGVKPYKPAACGDRSPLPFGQLPIVQHATEGGCVSIGQTVAAAQYIAALTGLAPVDDAAAMARATSACVGIQEMYDALFYGSFIPRMVTKVLCGSVCFAPARALARYRLRGKYEKCFSTFERWLRTTKAGDVALNRLSTCSVRPLRPSSRPLDRRASRPTTRDARKRRSANLSSLRARHDAGLMSALQVPSFEGGRGTELPAGWVRWVDPATDEYYYHNEETGETQCPAIFERL